MDFNLFSYLSLKLLQKLKIKLDVISENKLVLSYCTEIGFTSFLSGGFTIASVVNSLDRKLCKSKLCVMAIQVVEFSSGGYKIRKIFA